MRCSEMLRASQPVLLAIFAPATCARALAAPPSAVAELGIVTTDPKDSMLAQVALL